jgi:hypothetical protein
MDEKTYIIWSELKERYVTREGHTPEQSEAGVFFEDELFRFRQDNFLIQCVQDLPRIENLLKGILSC